MQSKGHNPVVYTPHESTGTARIVIFIRVPGSHCCDSEVSNALVGAGLAAILMQLLGKRSLGQLCDNKGLRLQLRNARCMLAMLAPQLSHSILTR